MTFEELRAALSDVEENAVHAADPRTPARDVARAFGAWMDSGSPGPVEVPAPAPAA